MGMSQGQSAGHAWRKSSRCDSNLCVEVSLRGGEVAVRDNAAPERHLSFDSGSWTTLLRAIHAGHLQR